MAQGRGQLTAFELMPREAGDIVDWASAELGKRERTQVDIYAEFVAKCEALMAERRGELEFVIPSFSSFNRHSIRQARQTRRLDETRAITRALADRHDAKTSDDLTILSAELIKSAVFYALGDAQDALEAKDIKALAEALRAAQGAQNLSSDRKAKEDKRTAERLAEAVDEVRKTRGMSAETAETIKAQILGIALAPEAAG